MDQVAVELARLESLCFEDPWSEAQVQSSLASPFCRVLGLTPAGDLWRSRSDDAMPQELCAYIVLQELPAESAFEILRIGVVPDRRGQGLGARIIDAAAIELRALFHSGALLLEVNSENAAALALYRKAGFVQSGFRKNYYGSGCHALLLRRDYPPEPGGSDPAGGATSTI